MSQAPLGPDFGGTVRLFPLPNLVLFPCVAQPLHIFEPRYRQLMADALADDRLITLALLQPGWEEDYHKRPPIHDTVCIGRISHEEHFPDGRYNLLLHGLSRARIRQEVPTDRLYRVARVEMVPDVPVVVPATEQTLRQTLAQAVTPFFAAQPQSLEQLQQLMRSPLSLGHLADIFAFALPLAVEGKQQLLDEVQVEARTRLLLRLLHEQAPKAEEATPRAFPPAFSEN